MITKADPTLLGDLSLLSFSQINQNGFAKNHFDSCFKTCEGKL